MGFPRRSSAVGTSTRTQPTSALQALRGLMDSWFGGTSVFQSSDMMAFVGMLRQVLGLFSENLRDPVAAGGGPLIAMSITGNPTHTGPVNRRVRDTPTKKRAPS